MRRSRSALSPSSTGPRPPFEEFVEHIAGRLPLIPRYRQKLRTVPLGLGAPEWVDDPDFDIRWHVRNTALPAPGGPDEIGRLMSRVMSQRMDRGRPLWEYWFCEGLAEGRWALLSKLHHSLADGVSGTDIYQLVLDPTPTPRPAVPDTWTPASRRRGRRPRPGRRCTSRPRPCRSRAARSPRSPTRAGSSARSRRPRAGC